MATAKRKQEVLDSQTDENSDLISDNEEEHGAKRQSLQWDSRLYKCEQMYGRQNCEYVFE